jgi:hypothetical protein
MARDDSVMESQAWPPAGLSTKSSTNRIQSAWKPRAGDLFWLREGIYSGDFTNFLSGTAQQPIIFRARRGHHARIHGTFNVYGSNVWLWGLELTDPTRLGAHGSEVGLFAPGTHSPRRGHGRRRHSG